MKQPKKWGGKQRKERHKKGEIGKKKKREENMRKCIMQEKQM